jgi:hypothetical protein
VAKKQSLAVTSSAPCAVVARGVYPRALAAAANFLQIPADSGRVLRRELPAQALLGPLCIAGPWEEHGRPCTWRRRTHALDQDASGHVCALVAAATMAC